MASKYPDYYYCFFLSMPSFVFIVRKFDNFLRGSFEMRNHHIILKSYTCTLILEARGQTKRPPKFPEK